ncbi:MAG: LysR family transcriptional regulator, partial [Anaerotignaceae bacterium]
MTLQQLNYVINISEVGSLNKAAEKLYIAQPSLTSSIQELEKELGITIFHRSGKGVSLTNDGLEFITYARQIFYQYETLMDKYGKFSTRKKKFAVSTQHYSFAVKTFIEMVKSFNTEEYEFAIRETKTMEVIEDVNTLRSEIGILYLDNFNRKAIEKILKSNGLSFCKLIDCKPYVYLWSGHPLAENEKITFAELVEYPCLSF